MLLREMGHATDLQGEDAHLMSDNINLEQRLREALAQCEKLWLENEQLKNQLGKHAGPSIAEPATPSNSSGENSPGVTTNLLLKRKSNYSDLFFVAGKNCMPCLGNPVREKLAMLPLVAMNGIESSAGSRRSNALNATAVNSCRWMAKPFLII